MRKYLLLLSISLFIFSPHTSFAKNTSYSIGSTRVFNQVDEIQADELVPQPQEPKGDALDLDGYYEKLRSEVISARKVVTQLNKSTIATLPVGIKASESSDDYMIIIDKASIHPEYAMFSAFMILKNPKDGKKIRFVANDIKFTFKNGLIGDFMLELADTLTTQLVGNAEIKWLTGSHVLWDCNGFKQIGLNGEIGLSKSMFIGVNPKTGVATDQQVKTQFFAVFNDINNVVFDFSLPAFKLSGFDEAYFKFDNVTIDASDYSNLAGFTLPANYPGGYTGEMANLWRGLYIKNATITLGKKFNKKNGDQVIFSASNLLIDDNGFTGKILGNNLLTLDEGKLGNWAMSINQLGLEFFTGSFKSFTFAGSTILPGSTSPLTIDAYVDAAKNYHIGITPGRDLDFNALAAKITIDASSRIDVDIVDGKFTPTALLNGTISFGCSADADTSKKDLVLPTLQFQEMRISTAPPVFDLKYLGFTSDKPLSYGSFPISLTSASYQKLANDQSAINFGVNIELTTAGDMGIIGETNLGIKINTGGDKWTYGGLQVNAISVDVKKGDAFHVYGQVMFARADPTYGNGFRGVLKAEFKDIKLDAIAVFGKTDFRYFFVDGFLDLGSTELPAGPLMISGFGGGLYYKMHQVRANDTQQGSEFGKSLSGVIYVPDNNSSVGFKAAINAGIIKKAIVDAKVNFEMAFNSSGGIDLIALNGQAEIVAPTKILSTGALKEMINAAASGGNQTVGSSAMIRASLSIVFDFVNHSFDTEMEIYANVANVLKGVGANDRAGWGHFHISSDTWYLHLGSPTDPMGMSFLGMAKTTVYFMAGHNIPDAMQFPVEVTNILHLTPDNANSERKEEVLKLGTGLAFGAAIKIDTGDLNFLIFYARLQLGAGFDIMLLDYGDAYCQGRSGQLGVNGWYAKGQAYAYFSGEIGIKVKIFGKRRKYEIISLATAAAIRLEGPNPTYGMGVVGGEYKILGGLIKGSCKFQAEFGEKCKVMYNTDLADIEIISDLAPAKDAKEVDIFTLPQAVFNFPVEKEVKIAENETSSKTFKIKLVEFNIYKDNVPMPGAIQWDGEKKTLAFTPNTIFSPSTKYKIVAKASFMEKVNGIWQEYKGDDGKVHIEEKSYEFTTGLLPDKIPASYITYTYPINRMANFYKTEYNKAYVIFKSDLAPFFAPTNGWMQKGRWTPKTGMPIYANLSYNASQKMAEVDVPTNLANEMVYKFELVNIPLDKNKAVDKNIVATETEALSDTANTAQVTTRAADGVIQKAEEKAFYALDFRTSIFNKLADKLNMNELTVRILFNVSPAIDFPGATVYSEPFDGFELIHSTNKTPLLNATAYMPECDWYQNNIYPIMYQNYPWNSTVTISNRNVSELGVPPTGNIDLYQVEKNYIMSDMDIEAGKADFKSDMTHIIFAVPQIWADDYVELRNKVALMASAKSPLTAVMTKMLNTYPWPQVSAGNYTIQIQYVLPGLKTVTSTKKIVLKNGFNIPQVNLITY